jgi:hypothetical protein
MQRVCVCVCVCVRVCVCVVSAAWLMIGWMDGWLD